MRGPQFDEFGTGLSGGLQQAIQEQQRRINANREQLIAQQPGDIGFGLSFLLGAAQNNPTAGLSFNRQRRANNAKQLQQFDDRTLSQLKAIGQFIGNTNSARNDAGAADVIRRQLQGEKAADIIRPGMQVDPAVLRQLSGNFSNAQNAPLLEGAIEGSAVRAIERGLNTLGSANPFQPQGNQGGAQPTVAKTVQTVGGLQLQDANLAGNPVQQPTLSAGAQTGPARPEFMTDAFVGALGRGLTGVQELGGSVPQLARIPAQIEADEALAFQRQQAGLLDQTNRGLAPGLARSLVNQRNASAGASSAQAERTRQLTPFEAENLRARTGASNRSNQPGASGGPSVNELIKVGQSLGVLNKRGEPIRLNRPSGGVFGPANPNDVARYQQQLAEQQQILQALRQAGQIQQQSSVPKLTGRIPGFKEAMSRATGGF